MIGHLATTAAVRLAWQPDSEDAWGRPADVWTADETLNVYRQPVARDEVTDQADAQMVTDRIFHTGAVTFTGRDRIRIGSVDYELVGPPKQWDTPDGRGYVELEVHRVA